MKGGRERRGLLESEQLKVKSEKAVKGAKGKKATPSVVTEPEPETPEVFDRAGMVPDADADKE